MNDSKFFFSGFVTSLLAHCAIVLAFFFKFGSTEVLHTPIPEIVYTVSLEGGALGGVSELPDEPKKEYTPENSIKLEEEENENALEIQRQEEKEKAKEEAKLKAEEEAKIKAAKKAEEKAKKKAKLEAKRKAAEEAKLKAAEEAKRKAEEAKRKAAEEAKRKAAEAKRKAAEEIKRKAAAKKRREARLRKALGKAKKRSSQESYDAGGVGLGAARGGGTTGRGGGTQASIEFIAYRNALERHVKGGWSWFPGRDKYSAVVSMSIRPDGVLSDVFLKVGSGNKQFDESVVRAVRKASPVPPPPQAVYSRFSKTEINFSSHE